MGAKERPLDLDKEIEWVDQRVETCGDGRKRHTGETRYTGSVDYHMQVLNRHDLVLCFFQISRGDPMAYKYIARTVLP